jgi:putative N6-adenine-specific DNA methylase
MCGSGTFPIEACMIASQIPAGKYRQFFGFQRWKNFDEDLFEKIKLDCNSKIVSCPVKIYGSDVSEEIIGYAQKNVAASGLSESIILNVADIKDLKAVDEGGFLFINPPYGQRIQPAEIDSLYQVIGSTLKHNFAGTTAWIITSNKDSLKHVGLKPKEKHILFNGALECLLLKYEMYQGTRKFVKTDITV